MIQKFENHRHRAKGRERGKGAGGSRNASVSPSGSSWCDFKTALDSGNPPLPLEALSTDESTF